MGYYQASEQDDFSFDQAKEHCNSNGMNLWCPSSNQESQHVFANTAYDRLADVIDGNNKPKKVEDFGGLKKITAWIGVKRVADTGYKGDSKDGLMSDFKCINPLSDAAWTFPAFSKHGDGPFEQGHPTKTQTKKKQVPRDCLAVGSMFSMKWSSEPCEIEQASRENPATFGGARAICVSRNNLYNQFSEPLDMQILEKVKSRFQELRKAILKLVATIAMIAFIVSTSGCFCCFCCYCCCCAPCRGGQAPAAATAAPAAAAVQPAAAPIPPPVAAPAPFQPPPPPQAPMYAPPQPMGFAPPMGMPMGGMGGINLNISNNNTNTNTNR